MGKGTMEPEGLVRSMEWRYAVKLFDQSKKIPAGLWDALERSLILSASSYGLQPYKFILVQDPAVRKKLTPVTWKQPQVETCSHFVVFAGRADVEEADVRRFVSLIARTRGVSEESLAGYRDAMVGDLVKGPRHAIAGHWAARQTYIALGTLLTSAAVLGVDACPMEGFDADAYDEILGLKGTGYHALCVCALGYRSEKDASQGWKKVRFGRETLVESR